MLLSPLGMYLFLATLLLLCTFCLPMNPFYKLLLLALVPLCAVPLRISGGDEYPPLANALPDWGEAPYRPMDEDQFIDEGVVENIVILDRPDSVSLSPSLAAELPKIKLGPEQGEEKAELSRSNLVDLHLVEVNDGAAPQANSKAVLKSEIEILEKQWNVSFKMDMKEKSAVQNSVQVGTVASLRTPQKKIKVGLDYSRKKGDGAETSNRFVLDSHGEWYFNASRWNPYLHGTLKYDKAKEFDTQMQTDAGLGYSIIRNPASELKLRAGATASKKLSGIEKELVPDSLYGIDLKQKITSGQQIKTALEYIPEWNQFSKYQVKTRANWEFLFGSKKDMSLNVGAANCYDSETGLKDFSKGVDYKTEWIWRF